MPVKRVTFIGEEYWASHLAQGLNARYPGVLACSVHSFQSISTGPKVGIGRLFRAHAVVRVGFPPLPGPHVPEYDAPAAPRSARDALKRALFGSRFGQALRRGVFLWRHHRQAERSMRRLMLIDRLSRFAARTGMLEGYIYWTGTDVQRFVERYTSGDVLPAELSDVLSMKSLAGAKHLADELAEVGVHAVSVPFPGITMPVPPHVPAMPSRMVVVSYVPPERRDYYGFSMLLAAARALTDVEFRLFKDDGAGVTSAPGNVTFLGHVDDVASLYAASSMVVRMVEHDAIGATVTEGLLYGRPVIYSYPLPHTVFVPFGDETAFVSELSELYRQHVTGGIPLNLAGREWAIKEFDPEPRFERLRDALLA